MVYSDDDVVDMTKNQWKKLIERNLADVVNMEITTNSAENKSMTADGGKLKFKKVFHAIHMGDSENSV